tara:strand:+ start:2239 stop:2616 length:378 start_codon:yes stop_codon:yes gene_type:complete
MQVLLPFLKAYWKHILVVILSAIYVGKTQYDYAVLYKMHMGTIEMYQDQIRKINNLHAQIARKKDKALEEYKVKIEDLEKQYKDKSEEIVIKNEKTKIKYKKKFNDNPKEIVEDIENTFGFQHVE